MKKLTTITISAIIMLFLSTGFVLAEDNAANKENNNDQKNDIVIYIEDEEVSKELEPIIRDDRTYAPVRNLAETLGADVKFKPEDRRIIISYDNLEISMWIDNEYVIVNDKETETDSPVFIENDRSYAPLRFLAEWFEYDVKWNEESRSVDLTPKYEKEEEKEDEKKEKEEKYEQPDFDIDLEDEKIRVELNIEDFQTVDEHVYKEEQKLLDVEFEDNEINFYFTGEKYYKLIDQFNDPLLEEIVVEPLDLDEIDDVSDDYEDNEELNINKLTFRLKYPIPENNFEYYDLLDAENKLEFNIFREFKEVKKEKELEAGLLSRNIFKGVRDGPLNINKLYFDPEESDLELDLVLAQDEIKGLESIEEIAKRKEAVAAINGGYFHWQGDPLGLTIKNGRLITHPRNSSSAFIMDGETNKAEIKQIDMGDDHKAIINDGEFELNIYHFNRTRGEGRVIVYTREYGEKTGTPDENDKGHKEFVVVDGKVKEINYGDSKIPEDGYVISVDEKNDDDWDIIKEDDEIKLEWDLEPELTLENISFAIGAGPGLISDGEINVKTEEEKVADNISTGRNPRTAIGILPDDEILLITVDGRAPTKSIGFELEELAEYLKDLGVKSALNLDGGGSTMMWLEDEIINHPSGATLRNIGNALVIS
ncbi:phosphodiester glycosidase family protein [Natranaerofaba carboxydovora]|uniref:phosphodiester glycosidase family protein n=1 Tax=Natranaerofaba carboxydovora TaxID=2742683 RepID=UPI001F12ACB8|nr:phosphodiester glycosidase family protein [Natranaerofaba carboxydovora]UMZ73804.1 Phosphodiester glycosidase [Natranaerofaba carboxydovora]